MDAILQVREEKTGGLEVRRYVQRQAYPSLPSHGSGRYELLTGGGRESAVAISSGSASSASSPSELCPSASLEVDIFFAGVDFVEDASDLTSRTRRTTLREAR